ncbi:MAG: twin-arginine translocase subunit TatC [Candidatus Melainabacteria bacterium]|nr:twin-arginine translocase subunit TatC [Candidatus Melainabacteria bacterium]
MTTSEFEKLEEHLESTSQESKPESGSQASELGSIPQTSELGSIPQTSELGSIPQVSELGSIATVSAAATPHITEVGSSPQESEEEEPAEGLMTVVEHLDELRARIIRSIGYIAVALVAMLFVTKDILVFLEKPAGNITFQALSLEEPVLVFFKVAFYAALIASSPFILFELSQFIAPGLTKKERAIMAPIVIGSPVLFVCGSAFAYYLLLPPMLHFFSSFGVGVSPINQRLDFYISLVSSILLYMGLCFQLPILIFALSFTGIVNSRMLLAIWKYAVAGITVIAAIVTPDPTAMSMLMVMAALIGLYFLSILLLKIFGR